jgi:hypothetical protein
MLYQRQPKYAAHRRGLCRAWQETFVKSATRRKVPAVRQVLNQGKRMLNYFQPILNTKELHSPFIKEKELCNPRLDILQS